MPTEGSNWRGWTSWEIINPVWFFLASLQEKVKIGSLELAGSMRGSDKNRLEQFLRGLDGSIEQVERLVKLGWVDFHEGLLRFLLDSLSPLRPFFLVFFLEPLKADSKSRVLLLIFEPL